MPVKGPSPPLSQSHRIGGWLPRDPTKIRDIANRALARAERENLKWTDVIIDLGNLINTNPIVFMLFTEMLTEVPTQPPYNSDGDLNTEINTVTQLLNTLNNIIQTYIPYTDTEQIGTPINAILDWPMATKAGFAAFLRDDVNQCLKNILAQWGNFLKGSDSALSITTGNDPSGKPGWLSPFAQSNSTGLKNFLQTYRVPNPKLSNYGFASWDAFFIRDWLNIDTQRPIASPSDPTVIASVAECTPFAFQEKVQATDSFWAKDQHYSLNHLLGDSAKAAEFVGGSVYQAFLSADCYHKWHAPVDGQWVDYPQIIEGTYYSEPLLWGFNPDVQDKTVPQPDIAADARSQGYIACCARRGVGYIQPNDKSLGLIAVVMIGMAEVSSIDFHYSQNGQPGGLNSQTFTKGQEIGTFHFGGSTHCIVFGPGVKFTPSSTAVLPDDPTHYNLDQPQVPVRSALGTLAPVQNKA